MSFVVTCHSCRRRFSAPDEAIGKTVDCPKCGASLDILRPEEITDAELDELFGTTGKSSSGVHRANTSGPADSQPNASSFPTIITNSPRTAKKRQNAHLPFILRLMKIATLVWLVGMLFCALIVYFGSMDDVLHDFGNGAVVDTYGDLISMNTLRARAISSAVISGLVIPTLFYVPTMAVLFVFWFIERESSKHDTPTA